MNSKFLKAVLACTATALVGFGSTGAQAATASANATATILAPVTVTKTADLLFGNIAATAADTVSITPAGVVNCGTLVCNGTQNPAAFSVTGVVGQQVAVSIPVTSATLTSGANTIPLSGLASNVASILLDGTDAFSVGGSIAVANGQASGTYTGSFNVDVNYF